MSEHRVQILHNDPPNEARGTCYAFCNTCLWRSPRVRFYTTAERWQARHINEHSPQDVPQESAGEPSTNVKGQS